MSESVQQWWCVRSVVSDGARGCIVDTDVMPTSALAETVDALCFRDGEPVVRPFGEVYTRWTWSVPRPGGGHASEMIIASQIL